MELNNSYYIDRDFYPFAEITPIICEMPRKDDGGLFVEYIIEGNLCGATFDGEVLIEPQYDGIEDTGNIVAVRKGRQYGFYNPATNKLIEPQYDMLYENDISSGFDIDVTTYYTDFIFVKRGRSYRIFDLKENRESSFAIQNFKPFVNGIGPVEVKGRWGIANSKGKFIIEPKHSNIRRIHKRFYLLDNTILVGEDGTVIMKDYYDYAKNNTLVIPIYYGEEVVVGVFYFDDNRDVCKREYYALGENGLYESEEAKAKFLAKEDEYVSDLISE